MYLKLFGGGSCVLSMAAAWKAFTLLEQNDRKSAPCQWNWNWDGRHEAKTKSTRHLFLIRHGQYHIEAEMESEKVLTSLGKEQAKFTGLRLKALNLPFTHIVHSGLIRAMETANIINDILKVDKFEMDNNLNEGYPCKPEPCVSKSSEIRNVDTKRLDRSFRCHVHRADADETKDTYEILVFHANAIRYFVCRALQIPETSWLRFSVDHAAVVRLDILPDGRVLLRSLGDSGHLPPEKISYV